MKSNYAKLGLQQERESGRYTCTAKMLTTPQKRTLLLLYMRPKYAQLGPHWRESRRYTCTENIAQNSFASLYEAKVRKTWPTLKRIKKIHMHCKIA